MKTRQGFVSNSSSSSFIIILDDKTRHLAHYDWKVTLEEHCGSNLENTIWDSKTGNFLSLKRIFERDEYQRDLEAEEKLHREWPYSKERGYQVWISHSNIYRIPEDTGLGRYTGISLGKDLLAHIEGLKQYNHHINTANKIEELIAKHGIDNIILLRQSDESMGGDLPKELEELCKTAVYEEEYH